MGDSPAPLVLSVASAGSEPRGVWGAAGVRNDVPSASCPWVSGPSPSGPDCWISYSQAKEKKKRVDTETEVPHSLTSVHGMGGRLTDHGMTPTVMRSSPTLRSHSVPFYDLFSIVTYSQNRTLPQKRPLGINMVQCDWQP